MFRSWLDSSRRLATEPAPLSDGLKLAALGLAVRLAVVVWAAGRFPPVEDGRFYHQLAERIAQGHGYTWLWPDGVVTHVAHYPVGYPALLAAGYRLFGASPSVGMLLGAALGALSVLAVHRIAASGTGRLGAVFAALAVALHPGLVMYTPALMTEGVAAALIALSAWLAVCAWSSRGRARFGFILALGACVGVGTLVRGQTLLFAPLFALVAAGGAHARLRWRSTLATLALVCGVALLCVAPWTARNCAKMDRCVAVSANVGWNLLIGSVDGATGTFVPIAGESVPPECRTVFGEADKDACFRRAALANIARSPLRWLSLVPKKLSHTFDYCGAAGWYLNVSSPSALTERGKLVLGTLETLWQRALLLLAFLSLASASGPRPKLRRGLAVLGALCLLSPAAWVAHLVLVGLVVATGRAASPAAMLVAAAVLGTTLTHAVFFGAGRYSLPVFPLIAALAGGFLGARAAPWLGAPALASGAVAGRPPAF